MIVSNLTVYLHLTEPNLPEAPLPIALISDTPAVSIRVGDAALILDQAGAILLSDALLEALTALREAEAAKAAV